MIVPFAHVLIFAAVLYFSGGATNPFAPLFLLPHAPHAACCPSFSPRFSAAATTAC